MHHISADSVFAELLVDLRQYKYSSVLTLRIKSAKTSSLTSPCGCFHTCCVVLFVWADVKAVHQTHVWTKRLDRERLQRVLGRLLVRLWQLKPTQHCMTEEIQLLE